jgi:hypothetical protein
LCAIALPRRYRVDRPPRRLVRTQPHMTPVCPPLMRARIAPPQIRHKGLTSVCAVAYIGRVGAATSDAEALGFCSEPFNGHAVAAVEQSPRAFALRRVFCGGGAFALREWRITEAWKPVARPRRHHKAFARLARQLRRLNTIRGRARESVLWMIEGRRSPSAKVSNGLRPVCKSPEQQTGVGRRFAPSVCKPAC